MKIVWTSQARDSLRDVYLYYKREASPKIARKIKSEILNRPSILNTHPESGQEEDLLKELGKGHRYLVVFHFKIVYRIDYSRIIITDLFDTRQDPGKMMTRNK